MNKTLKENIFSVDEGFYPKEDVILASKVKEFVETICGKMIVEQGASDYVLYGNEMVDFIELKSGFALQKGERIK